MSLIDIVQNITTLEGKVPLYKDAEIDVREVSADDVYPTQKYLIQSHIDRLKELADRLATQRIDIFQLDDILEFEDKMIAPPLVEWCEEDQKAIIVDGTHRFWLARELKKPIKTIYVKGVNQDYPVYALPVEWAEVKVYDEPPQDPNLRRIYRIQPENGDTLFKKYFRDLSPLGSKGKRPRKGEEHLMLTENS